MLLTLSERLCPPGKTAAGKLVFRGSCQIRAYRLEWDIGFAVVFLEPVFLHLNLIAAYVVMMSPNHNGKPLVSPTVCFWNSLQEKGRVGRHTAFVRIGFHGELLKAPVKGWKLVNCNNRDMHNWVGEGNYLILWRFCKSTAKCSQMTLLSKSCLIKGPLCLCV